LDYYGLSLQEAREWGWKNLVHPGDLAGIVDKWRTAVATGKPYEHEVRARTASGEYRWCLSEAASRRTGTSAHHRRHTCPDHCARDECQSPVCETVDPRFERAVVLCEGETFTIDEAWLKRESIGALPPAGPLVAAVDGHEKELIEAALTECRGQVGGPRGAAIKLGVARQTLESRIASLRIDKYRFKIRR
jgi:PAS fold